jgi:hypothetical protein
VLSLVGPSMFTEVLSITEAIVNGGLFLAAGSNAAHYTYDIATAIAYLQKVGATLSYIGGPVATGPLPRVQSTSVARSGPFPRELARNRFK